ncbi:cyclase family protein [Cytophagaceae bacterium DM2B3-1]|uniref:Cyclase family protein n=1 Tax=Xanthocytophaga flava TaxID=3048013 RepID=A0ABT7CX45_9BACT|nr:cyclase family protein [Xanthocytophaga flavus]MDJ1498343.1 cyclase family protein [Xanthocytophaga flavus]
MKIVDLSATIYHNMKVYPGDPQVRINIVHTYQTHEWELRELSMGTHTGTHVDAFSHMHVGGQTIDKIPLEKFCGKAWVANPQEILPKQCGLVFREEANIDLLEKIIAAQPPFVAGVITADLERELLRQEIITYTDLVNLDLLPVDQSFLFYGFPLKIKDGDGSPVRVVAILE